jgi:hypothetical protein
MVIGSKRFPKESRSERRVPSFDSGMISEPLLAFGGGHKHVDPKTGLALYGPYSLEGQSRGSVRSINVGIVGPGALIGDAEAWLHACKGVLTNDGREPFLRPHFPGFNESAPFECEIVTADAWREGLKEADIRFACSKVDFSQRVKSVVNLYVRALEVLCAREPRPAVVLCCIPQEVIDCCTVQRGGQIRSTRRHRRRSEVELRQLRLFEDEATLGIEDEEFGHQNLRRGLKAEAMEYGMPTQLVWPRSLKVSSVAELGTGRVQDVATRAWNFTTALYHKAGGSPWRLAEVEPGTCFVGISFYREILSDNPAMRTSMAQAFTAAGDGYVLRGSTFEWDERERGKSPHLTKELAAGLLRDVIEMYKRQNRERLPGRLVVHKSSRFTEEELLGFEEACQLIPRKDFVALGGRGLQFYRTGDYPALRGTYIKFSESDLLLYTSGYVPFLRTYPGARVPQPLEVLEHHGDSPWDTVLREILALTKMNWNTADFACRDPITLAFSRRVGQILAEVPPDAKIRQEYRFYM